MNNKKIMKKRILILFLCLCLTCSLYACGGKTASGGADYQNGDNAIEKLSRGCYNEYGCYECDGSLVYFFDMQSKQKIVLCNNPNCKHDSEECNAYVYSKAAPANELHISMDSDGVTSISEDYSSTMFMFAEGDRLYILLTDGTMLSMKYDGTDRKKVAEIDSKYSFGTGESYKLGKEIIMRAYYSVQEQGEIVEKTCFITYNTDTNKWKQGAAFDKITANRARVKGLTYDKEAIFYQSDEPPVVPQGTPAEEGRRLINSTKCKVYSMNIETGEKKDIFSGTLGDCSDVIMLSDKIYIYSENQKQLCEMDAKTGELSVLLDNYSDSVMFGEPVGSCLDISRTKDALKDDGKNPDPENVVSEFYNVETKELFEAYETESNIEWCNTFEGIIAETEDYYIMPYKAEYTIEYSEYGYPMAQTKERKMGFISKKDFWNKNYNFEEIEW